MKTELEEHGYTMDDIFGVKFGLDNKPLTGMGPKEGTDTPHS
jgi:hypothetical protein